MVVNEQGILRALGSGGGCSGGPKLGGYSPRAFAMISNATLVGTCA